MTNEFVKRIQEFRLLDDDFMNKVFEDDYECIELMLHIIMGKQDLKVQKAHTQYSIKNLEGRSVRLDIYAIDTTGKKYNIEVQRADKGAGVKRARYNSSVIDTKSLPAGMGYEALPETYVIFITENDVIGGNKSVYHVDRVIKETGEAFGDGAHIVYVNGAYRDNTPIGLLMHDFSCKNPDDMHYKILADRTRYFKEDKEGVAAMCKMMEELIDEEKKEIALRMLKSGEVSKEYISVMVGLSVEAINLLEKEETAAV